MTRNNPCHNCEERCTYCRVRCEKWIAYVNERDAEYINPKRLAETGYVGHVIDRMERCRKRMRKKNKRQG